MKDYSKKKEPVKIRFKQLSNGNKSIYLDIYSDGKRRYEFLKLYIIPGNDPQTKVKNENAMTRAQKAQAERVIELQNGKVGIKNPSKVKLLEWIEATYPNNISMNSLCKHLKKFMDDKDCLLAKIDRDFCAKFIDYLSTAKRLHSSEKRKQAKEEYPITNASARQYIQRFTTVLNEAVRRGIIDENPVKRLSGHDKESIKGKATERVFLTANELSSMIQTEIKQKDIRRAFLFACYCGLRISDVRSLIWDDLKLMGDNWFVVKCMKKTGEIVSVPLEMAQRWLPNRNEAKGSDHVFNISQSTASINYALKSWAKKAGVKKTVTFHTSRHTFATLLLTAGADLYTTSKLLGHTNISTTQIYAKIVDAKKVDAIKLLAKMGE